MARGHQAIESQQKNAKKQAQLKKQAAGGNKDSNLAQNKFACPACFLPMTGYPNFKTHFEAKHPKLPLPSEEELKGAPAA